MEGKPAIPSELCHLLLHSKGYLPEIEIQDFPLRGKAVYLRIKRRRREDPTTGQTYSRDWSLVATGTRIAAEFVSFLKVPQPQSVNETRRTHSVTAMP